MVQKGSEKRCHDSCLLSVWFFPKRSVFNLSHCVKRKILLLVWDFQSGCQLSFSVSLAASP